MSSLFEDEVVSECVVLEFPEFHSGPVAAGLPAVEEAVPPSEHLLLEQQIAAREAAMQQQLTQACAQAAAEAQERAEARFHDALATERSALAVACASFAKARERYFGQVESEVVRLSLAIASRILHREVQMDPLLLMGVVRVALSKLTDAESATLHVPVVEVELWRRAMRSQGVRVQPDAALQPGDARITAQEGVVQLGVAAQLEEIERGFFDLLAKRPA